MRNLNGHIWHIGFRKLDTKIYPAVEQAFEDSLVEDIDHHIWFHLYDTLRANIGVRIQEQIASEIGMAYYVNEINEDSV